jgi:hypothetical protein
MLCATPKYVCGGAGAAITSSSSVIEAVPMIGCIVMTPNVAHQRPA